MSALSNPEPDRAEEVLARYVERRLAGERVELEAFCTEHASLAERLRTLVPMMESVLAELSPQATRSLSRPPTMAEDVDPRIALDTPPPHDGPSRQLLERLWRHSPTESRYVDMGLLGRGGMGEVRKVWDEDLRRALAKKVVLGWQPLGREGALSPVEQRTLGRFLEEAQVTGQLDHPGIVPVHELGVDQVGQVYFTMRLVRGRSLAEVFDRMRSGDSDWKRTRVLNVLLRVCEAVAFAHGKGVIHRDLKPSNVMVGDFGEVYVMDWGLAKVAGQPDHHDLRIVAGDQVAGAVQSHRSEELDLSESTPLRTADGQVLGTPAYMSPEQALGKFEEIDERADVYALGAVLYELLTGVPPYLAKGERISNQALLTRVQSGPPASIHDRADDVPVELGAICDKALARDRQLRYDDMTHLAADLRAFLEGRVVSAHETGAWAEARKWVLRNQPLAAASATTILAVTIGGIGFAIKADEATRAAEAARAETAKVLRLSDVKRLQELEHDADSLWPPHPDRLSDMESWLERARGLAANLPGHREDLKDMRAHARSWIEVGSRRTWSFGTTEEQWQHDVLAELIEGLEAMESGLLAEDGITPNQGWSVPGRFAFAQELESGLAADGGCSKAWSEALPAIADVYPDLALQPQTGLLPIGPDPASGLWEFADLMTGAPAVRNPDGTLVLTEETGVVFVLLRGGPFRMGAQAADPNGSNFDPQALVDESPLQEITLAPFFLSKYEMTQGQWLRLTGQNPSAYGPQTWDSDWSSGSEATLLHPVEQVSWFDCTTWLARAGMMLPTEAQWEYAARGGTRSPWWSGADVLSLRGCANLADSYASVHGAEGTGWLFEMTLDDGATMHSTIGSYRANPFGLHDMVGNLWEWCRDTYGPSLSAAARPGDGERAGNQPERIVRGSSFDGASSVARSSARQYGPAGAAAPNLGVRPARALAP